MKTTTKKLTAILLCLLLFLTGFMALFAVRPQKAEAFAENISFAHYIYYFSDSDPCFKKTLENKEMDRVVYDVHTLSSSQEFKFMLYSGYFWKFQDQDDVTVIVEIKTVELDENIWRDLRICLEEQGCKYMFIYPEYNENTHMTCSLDGYNKFLKSPFVDENSNTIKDYTAVLIDGRMVGIGDNELIPFNLDVPVLLRNPTLRKLLYYCNGMEESEIEIFEEELYSRLWGYYVDSYSSKWGFSDEFQNMAIEYIITGWKDNYYCSNITFWNGGYDQETGLTLLETYREFEKETIAQYFEETNFLGELQSKTRLIAHIENDEYVDLCEMREYTLSNYGDLFDFLEFGISPYAEVMPDDGDYYNKQTHAPITVCGMAFWKMKDAFYDFLYDAQSNAMSKPNGFDWNIDELPVYLWIIDPIQWGDGLHVETGEGKIEPTYEEEQLYFEKLIEIMMSR